MNYPILADHYEQCLEKYGPTPQGVDWPNAEDAQKRLQIMLELFQFDIQSNSLSVLDLGCGYGAFYDYLKTHKKFDQIHYQGIDLSQKMIETASVRHPTIPFSVRDILKDPLAKESVDYVVMNGVLTEKNVLSWQEMRTFAQMLIMSAFQACRKGLAFNVMSNHVDWCRLDLFHWGLDDLTQFLKQHCSRHFVVRSDYQLYEYTIYVYRKNRI